MLRTLVLTICCSSFTLNAIDSQIQLWQAFKKAACHFDDPICKAIQQAEEPADVYDNLEDLPASVAREHLFTYFYRLNNNLVNFESNTAILPQLYQDLTHALNAHPFIQEYKASDRTTLRSDFYETLEPFCVDFFIQKVTALPYTTQQQIIAEFGCTAVINIYANIDLNQLVSNLKVDDFRLGMYGFTQFLFLLDPQHDHVSSMAQQRSIVLGMLLGLIALTDKNQSPELIQEALTASWKEHFMSIFLENYLSE